MKQPLVWITFEINPNVVSIFHLPPYYDCNFFLTHPLDSNLRMSNTLSNFVLLNIRFLYVNLKKTLNLTKYHMMFLMLLLWMFLPQCFVFINMYLLLLLLLLLSIKVFVLFVCLYFVLVCLFCFVFCFCYLDHWT